jgi:beta-glucan synthesis-associated protein KRE6
MLGILIRPTSDLEWYDPSVSYLHSVLFLWLILISRPRQAITTENGKLVITLTEQSNHNLNFMSGMFISSCLVQYSNFILIQGMLTSWNKFCFTTGYIEVSVSMPGSSTAPGLWPGMLHFFVMKIRIDLTSSCLDHG